MEMLDSRGTGQAGPTTRGRAQRAIATRLSPATAQGSRSHDAGAPPVTLTATQTLIPDPSWTCGMPNGIAPPPSGQLVFAADLTLGVVHDVGETQYGHRTLIEIKGGTVSGPKIKGQFMNFGLDWQLELSNGAVEDEQVDVIQTGRRHADLLS